MRKILCVVLFALMVFALCGCSRSENVEKGKKWDCSVLNPEQEKTIIVYSDVKLQTDSGQLCFQNRNDFPVHFYLYSDDEEEPLVFEGDIPVGGVTTYEQVNSKYKYRTGFHADVPEGTDIDIMVYDGNAEMEPY